MEGSELITSQAVIDNGSFGKRVVRFETGLLAKQAGGSATIYIDDDTMLVSCTTASSRPREGMDFFPLTVEVEERMYAAGRIPGAFFRREGRPSEGAILACRLIDRPLRPLFTKGLRNDVNVIVTVLSLNPDVAYDVVAINAASLSTQLSGLPFAGPVGGIRVALIGDQWVGFPTVTQLADATFDMVVAGGVLPNGDVAISMVEAESTEQTWDLVRSGRTAPTEEVVAEGLEAAKPFIKALCDAQAEVAAKAAKPTAEFPVYPEYTDEVYAAVETAAAAELDSIMQIGPKHEREDAQNALRDKVVAELGERLGDDAGYIHGAFNALSKKIVRQRVLRDKVRIDGRGLADIRPLSAEVELIPRAHGSALFQRGETQIMGVTTLNMLDMMQKLDTLAPETEKRYIHHYNFPPYSTGETGRVGSPKRREIGHGFLAERALVPVLPSREEFPYAIRQVSEALGSNGSTSMGSVCASTLSLLNAGVPLRAPVAGIAMGLVTDEVDGETRYAALTDILGAEDALGDMDFKVAGTAEFITALQLDTKLDGIPSEVLDAALQQAHDAERHPRRHEGLPALDGVPAVDDGADDAREGRGSADAVLFERLDERCLGVTGLGRGAVALRLGIRHAQLVADGDGRQRLVRVRVGVAALLVPALLVRLEEPLEGVDGSGCRELGEPARARAELGRGVHRDRDGRRLVLRVGHLAGDRALPDQVV